MSGGGIVERLRYTAAEITCADKQALANACIDAAAEIERLQAALDDIRTTFGDGAGEHARTRAAAALGTALHAAQALPAAPAPQSAPERAGGLSGRPCVCCPDAYACAQAGCQLERHPSPEGTP